MVQKHLRPMQIQAISILIFANKKALTYSLSGAFLIIL